MSLKTHEIYEFANFRLDLAERVLLRDGKSVPVTPKVLETLQVFVENAGRLIDKAELMDLVWRERYVEESNLSFNIKMLRRALGDEATNPRFIETVPKHGYRFIAPVTHVLSDKPSRDDRTVEPNRATSVTTVMFGLRSRHIAYVMAGLTIVAIGFGYYSLFSKRSAASNSSLKTFAVLPIRPIDSTNRDEDFEVGIADTLINRINSIKGFFARPLNSTRKYRDVEQDSVAAGREQKVGYVLVSTYQLAGEKLRITSQLINVESESTEEIYTIEKDVRDVFAMQDAIAIDIGNRLMARFSTTATGPIDDRGTNSKDAYRLYQQGMYMYDRRTLRDAENTLDKLERATQLDSNYAKAWAGKAHVYRSLGNFSGSRSPHEEYRKSIAAVTRALELDENLADAHSALCENKFFYEYDYVGAERECNRAIELDANSSLAHEIYSRCLWTLGRFDEAIAEVNIALDLEPTSLFSQRNLAISLFYARRLPEAVQQFERVSEMDPNYVANYAWFVPALLVDGRKDEAFEWFIKWQTLLKSDEKTVQEYRNAYRASGWHGIGPVRVKKFDENAIRSYFLEACLIVHTGNKDKTLEYLEKSYQRREWGIPFLRTDPSLDSLRDDPRFNELASRVDANNANILGSER